MASHGSYGVAGLAHLAFLERRHHPTGAADCQAYAGDEGLAQVARSRSGFRDLFLGISMRGDGDVLVTYFQRSDDHDQLMSWLGPHDGLRGLLLLDNAWSVGGPFLVPGLAAVIAGSGSLFDQHLVSRVLDG